MCNPTRNACYVNHRARNYRMRMGVCWQQAKPGIIRHAIRSYRAQPWYAIPASASILHDKQSH
jgi:hypothetical protein